jgi:hypothetical protein
MMPSDQHQRGALIRAVAVRPDVVRSHFGNVPELAWNSYIGGYQPPQKWLEDRKGGAVGAWVSALTGLDSYLSVKPRRVEGCQSK